MGELWERLDAARIRCYACGHACPLPDGAVGVCKVRFNRGGRLHVPWGYVGGVQCDPIEKKPFFHAWPGALAYSFGMLGCDLHCAYCQNWVTSQALRDPAATTQAIGVEPEALVAEALRHGARLVVSTYNEPLITSEWAVAVFRAARAAGLRTAFVSNGNATPRVLDYLQPWVDLYKVDLKSFDDRRYRQLGGRLDPILDTIRRLRALDVWLEVVTLLVPGFNDSDAEIDRLTAFLAEVSPDIPWHVTAFHTDYRMTDRPATTAASLQACRGHRRPQWTALRLCGQPPRKRRGAGAHVLPGLRACRDRAGRVPGPRLRTDHGRRLPGLRDANPGALGPFLRRTGGRPALSALAAARAVLTGWRAARDDRIP